jgi:hypothetical protein
MFASTEKISEYLPIEILTFIQLSTKDKTCPLLHKMCGLNYYGRLRNCKILINSAIVI